MTIEFTNKELKMIYISMHSYIEEWGYVSDI